MIESGVNWEAISAIASAISVIAFIVLTFMMWRTNKKQMQAQIAIQNYKELRSLYSNVIEIENLMPRIIHGVMIELQYIGDEKAAERLNSLKLSVKEAYDKTMLLSADYKHFLDVEAKDYCMIFHLLTDLITLAHRSITYFNVEHISIHRNIYMPYQIDKARKILMPKFQRLQTHIPEDIETLKFFYALCKKSHIRADFSEDEIKAIVSAYKLFYNMEYPFIKVDYKDLPKLIKDSCLCIEIFSFNTAALTTMENLIKYINDYPTKKTIEQIQSKIYIQ